MAAAPLRKKRNFKALALDVTVPAAPAEPSPIPTREAPTVSVVNGTGKRRPPPLKPSLKPSIGGSQADGASEEQPVPSSSNGAGSNSSQTAAVKNSNRMTMRTQLSTTLSALNMDGVRLELKNEDLVDLQELGQGNGGSVKKVRHVPSGTIMAKKVVLIDAKPSVRKQILRELQIMHDCHSQYIIEFHGAFLADPNICMCIEFMDKGSFDGIYKKLGGGIGIDIVAHVAIAVLEGLTYLYDVHRIIHRDIKPSNILCNSKGQIKICDFGVSGELINSIADTFVGTSTYMSPERIQGAQYTVKSDVWSLGISLIELALGRFPFSDTDPDDSDLSDLEGTLSPSHPLPRPKDSAADKERREKRKSEGVSLQGGGMTMSILELLQHIVNEPAPELAAEEFSPEAHSFVEGCLLKDPEERKTPQDLLKHVWIENARNSNIDLEAWANTF